MCLYSCQSHAGKRRFWTYHKENNFLEATKWRQDVMLELKVFIPS